MGARFDGAVASAIASVTELSTPQVVKAARLEAATALEILRYPELDATELDDAHERLVEAANFVAVARAKLKAVGS